MTTVHFTTGLPGSGKTTHTKQLVAESGGTLQRINLDDIRAMTANGVYSKENEAVALRVQDKAVLAALTYGFDVILDNTHLHRRIPDRILTTLATRDVEFKVHSFLDVPLEECIRRDEDRRKRGERHVGKDVIERMHRKRTKWALTEEWLTAQHLRVEPYRADPLQPNAVIVDLDGTLALHRGRSPYDTARCLEDDINMPLAVALGGLSMRGVRTILLTGRDEEFRPHTESWLYDQSMPYQQLFMRPQSDRRRDDIVKYELFNKHIRDHYNVLMAFDDRDRVVTLWRAMGIMTAQMAWGDF